MTISLIPKFSEIPEDGPIPADILTYLRAESRNLFHELVLVEFVRQKKSGAVHAAKLARRIGKDAAVLTRLLGGPGNWTSDTTTDLLAGMGKKIVEVRIGDLADHRGVSAIRPPRAPYEEQPATDGQQQGYDREAVALNSLFAEGAASTSYRWLQQGPTSTSEPRQGQTVSIAAPYGPLAGKSWTPAAMDARP